MQQDGDVIASKSLVATLRELQTHRLVEHPPTQLCPYRLTCLGHGLLDQYDVFAGWVLAHLDALNLEPAGRRPSPQTRAADP